MSTEGHGSDLRLLLTMIAYRNRVLWRTPIGFFFALALPLIFLLIFTVLFGNEEIDELGVTMAQFYAPTLAVFGAVFATYTDLAMRTAVLRDDGVLRRLRGTPLPPWICLAGLVGSASSMALASVVVMMAVGVYFYGIQVFPQALPSAVLTLGLGVVCFASLGLLVAAVSPTSDAVAPIANATIWPVAMISNIFIVPRDGAPEWIGTVSSLFPLKHFAVAFQHAFSPTYVAEHGSWLGQLHWTELSIMAGWALGAAVLALRLFRWEPSSRRASAGTRAGAPAS